MTTFRDTEHLYRVLDAFFKQVTANDEVSKALLAGQFVLQFRYKEPVGQVTIDLRKPPITWAFDDAKTKPDLTMIQSADIAHLFWLGRLNIATAIATRKVVSRGPVSKALKLLPALKNAYPLYASVLRDLGEEHLIPTTTKKPKIEKWQDTFAQLVKRIEKGLPAPVRKMLRPRKETPTIDWASLNAHLIPLVDETSSDELVFRAQKLPKKKDLLRVEMLRRMKLIRAFEQKLSDANAEGTIPTEAIHLSIGQEAVAVGACFALRADDYVATTHRGHGHMLAKGADLSGMMAEILGKASGLCKGKGGSMHVTDAAVGAIGANGIVGASGLMAIGAAHSAVQRGTDQVAVAFLGDGATNQGMFHEALNFAAVFDLPVIFVVENNLYGEFTSMKRHCRVGQLSDRAKAYGIAGETVDGNDVWAVHQAMKRVVSNARKGKGPTLLECLTYRWHGHMEGETVDYRSADEIAEWKERCPIKHFSGVLSEESAIDDAKLLKLDFETNRHIEDAFQSALDSPDPTTSEVHKDVFAPEPKNLFAPTPTISCEREITCSQALYEALNQEMARDESVYLLGEDVATGGYMAVTVGLAEAFGTERIIDTPISEYAIVGSAVGAAMTGRRPIAEILFSDFLTTCADPLVNQAAKLRYMSGGQYQLPLVLRTPGGGGLGMAAQHSQSLEALFTGVPGLIIVAPATPYDAKGMLIASIRSNNPVLFFENKLLYTVTGPVPEESYIVPLGVADVKRQGSDVTVVSVGAALGKTLEAAEQLRDNGIEAEVVDVRSLVPLDLATITRSVLKTGRLVTVEDGSLFHGFGGEIIAQVTNVAFGALKSAPKRVAGLDVPISYNVTLENLAIPDAERIVQVVANVVSG